MCSKERGSKRLMLIITEGGASEFVPMQNIFRVVKPRRMKLAEHVRCMR
jgi:hypothetical protein